MKNSVSSPADVTGGTGSISAYQGEGWLLMYFCVSWFYFLQI